MEERKAKGKTAKGSAAGDDMISKLPNSLISQMLLYLPTKEAVRTSVLSNRWKSLWLLIPELDLASSEFSDYNTFVSFMDRLLGFCREKNSCLHKLKLSIRKDGNDQSCVTRWIDFVATPKLKHLDVECRLVKGECLELMPLSLYVCETLLYLRLHRVLLGSLKSVSLPRLKTMHLHKNVYANETGPELLISSCPVLEDLSIVRRFDDNVKILRVHSQSLTSLSIEVGGGDDEDYDYDESFDHDNSVVLIDAPRLKYLNFDHEVSHSKIISNSGSLTKVNILGHFYLWDDVQRRNFFSSILGVKDMNISWETYEIIEEIMPLPQFRNLSCLEAELYVVSLESVPTFLESFPNLKSLTLDVLYCSVPEEVRLSFVPQCLLSSLEFVELKGIFWGEPIMEVARYFAESSVILKKLVLRLGGSMLEENPISRDLLALPRRSSTCQIIVC